MAENQYSINETISLRPRETILNEMAEFHEQARLFEQEHQPLFERINALPHQQQSIIYQYLEFNHESVDSDEKLGELPEDVSSIVRDIQEYLPQSKTLENRFDTLTQELLPYEREDLRIALEDVFSRFNYDAVFDYYTNLKKEDDFGLPDTLRDCLTLRYYYFELIQNIRDDETHRPPSWKKEVLEQFVKNWKEKGFILDQPNEKRVSYSIFGSDVKEKRDQLTSKYQIVINQLKESIRLRDIYHTTKSFVYPFSLRVEAGIYKLISSANMYSTTNAGYNFEHFEDMDFDMEFVEAAQRHLQMIISASKPLGLLPKSEDKLDTINSSLNEPYLSSDEILKKITFEGFDIPEGMVAVTTPELLIEKARKILPPDFLNKLVKISVAERPKRLDSTDPTIETIGSFRPKFNQEGVLESTVIEIYKKPFVEKDSNETKFYLAKRVFEEILWHEFGHNAHSFLDYDEMLLWEKLIIEDPVNLTSYVKHSKTISENIGKREDFAETFMTYLVNPYLLSLISPGRFDYMENYFLNHLPSNQAPNHAAEQAILIKIAKDIFQKNGYTMDLIKTIYLDHETS